MGLGGCRRGMGTEVRWVELERGWSQEEKGD